MTANNGRDFTGSQCDHTCTVDCGHCKGDHTRYPRTTVSVTLDTKAVALDLIDTISGALIERLAELERNVEDRTDERDQAFTRIDGLDNDLRLTLAEAEQTRALNVSLMTQSNQQLDEIAALTAIDARVSNNLGSCSRTVMRLKDSLADMGRQRDAAIDDVERLQADLDKAWRTIAQQTLNPIPPSVFDGCIDWHQDSDSRTGIVTTRVEHLITHAPTPPKAEQPANPTFPVVGPRVAWNSLPVPGITGDTSVQP